MPAPPPRHGPHAPVVIERGGDRALPLLCVCSVLLACSSVLLAAAARTPAAAIGWAGIATSGAGAAACVAALVRPQRLTVDRDGITWRGLPSWWLPWGEVAAVGLRRSGDAASVLVERRARTGGRRPRPRAIRARLQLPPEAVLSLLRERLAAAREAGPAEAAPRPPGAVPWASLAIAAVLAAVFAAECRFPVAPGRGPFEPDLATLSAFGGSSRALTVGQGQWFRALLAPLLHANLSHLLGNAAALVWAGWGLEGLVGRACFLAIYAAGALAGEAASLLVHPPNDLGVGASGATMALFAASMVLSLRWWNTALRGWLLLRVAGLLAPALFPPPHGPGEPVVDVAGHVGGALAGAFVALALMLAWPRAAARPPGRRLAGAAAGLAVAATLAAAWPAADRYAAAGDTAAVGWRFIQAGDLAGARRRVGAVLKRMPGEPDAWTLAGAVAFADGDAARARTAFDRAFSLAPVGRVLAMRGLAALYADDGDAARADLARASALDRGNLELALWLAIARARAGGSASLDVADLGKGRSGWPMPIARMYAGLETPGALRAEAARLGPGAVCEAELYTAAWDRARGDERAARGGFGRAVRGCPPASTVAGMARLELGRGGEAPGGAPRP